MTIDFISLVIGLLIGLALAGAFLWSRRGKDEQVQNAFSVMAQDVLDKNSERFLQLAQEKLKQAQGEGIHDLEKRRKAIEDMVTPIGKTLQEMGQKVETLGKAGSGIESQLKTFAEDQKMLRQETQSLVQALRNPAARGRWGEMQLQRTLEVIGMIEGTHFTQQTSVTTEGVRRQPDFIVKLPGEMQIIIDVKTPVEPYWDALEAAETEAGQQQAVNSFRRKVRDHLKQLSSKEYWRHFDAPEFVVMFLPTEGLYSMAVSNDPSLIEEAANNNVILASPTTVMGLLRVIKHGWQQRQMADEAKTVAALALELYNRVAKFADHMRKVGSGLGMAMNAYNDAVGSLERSVLPGARKFKELHVQTGGREITELNEIDNSPRALSAPDFETDIAREDIKNQENEEKPEQEPVEKKVP